LALLSIKLADRRHPSNRIKFVGRAPYIAFSCRLKRQPQTQSHLISETRTPISKINKNKTAKIHGGSIF